MIERWNRLKVENRPAQVTHGYEPAWLMYIESHFKNSIESSTGFPQPVMYYGLPKNTETAAYPIFIKAKELDPNKTRRSLISILRAEEKAE